MGSDSKFLFKYFIESDETKLPIDGFVKIKKESSKLVNVLLSEIDIAKLPSGNYYLVIEARDKENKIAATCNLFFQRSNPDLKPQPADFSGVDAENTFVAKITDLKLLDDYINSLYPISSQLDYQFSQDVLKFADIKAKQRYFYSFWLKRKPDAPEKAWLSYLDQVNKVNDAYGCRIIKGYMSDRGRVFLKYGPPNTIYNNESEPSAYPYEIWHYYKLSNQGNVRFVFYSPDLVSNCYELLHSEAIGEVHNQQWQVTLYGRNTIPGNIDLETPTKHWGSEVDDFFRHPR
jgi:GWxTD domain-containing protein